MSEKNTNGLIHIYDIYNGLGSIKYGDGYIVLSGIAYTGTEQKPLSPSYGRVEGGEVGTAKFLKSKNPNRPAVGIYTPSLKTMFISKITGIDTSTVAAYTHGVNVKSKSGLTPEKQAAIRDASDSYRLPQKNAFN